MTETLTAKADNAITDLEGMLRAAESRREMEVFEYAAKRDKMVKVAHKKGTDNGIGVALDDLLEEFDLPRRPWRGTLQFLMRIDYPVASVQGNSAIVTRGGSHLYAHPHGPAMRVLLPLAASANAFLYDGTCLCTEDPIGVIRTWITEYVGEGAAEGVNFQFARLWCNHEDCVSRTVDGGMRDEAIAAFDWSGIESHPVVVPA